MKAKAAGRLAWSLALFVVLVAVVGLVFGLKSGSSLLSYKGGFAGVGVIAFAVLGAVLASRRPSNPIGWIYITTAALFGLSLLGNQVATYGLVTNPGAVPAAIGAWLSVWVWTPGNGSAPGVRAAALPRRPASIPPMASLGLARCYRDSACRGAGRGRGLVAQGS